MTSKISVRILGVAAAVALSATGCGAAAESGRQAGGDPPADVSAEEIAAVDVPSLISSTGCLACHALHGRGGAVGPPLESLAEKDERYVRRAIENPNADTAPGFEAFAGTMPPTFADILTPAELEALVRYLLAGAPEGG